MENPLMSGAELGRAFESGTIDPVEALEQYLARASQTKHVFIARTEERARAEAKLAAERWRRKQPLGPLDGVPIAWKDLFDVRGTVTTAGAAVFTDHPPATEDAKLVAMAARAGLVCLGKTNLVEFAFSGIGINPHFGTPHNPFDAKVARVPGGSSSGSAVAVAVGAVPISMGTDTAGSIRIPAAFNGLVGFKSSSRHYSRDGVFPLSRTLDSLGPLAHTVEDCILLDALFHDAQPPRILAADLAQQRFVVDEVLLHDPRVEEGVRKNLERALDALRAQGARIEHRKVDALHEVWALIERIGWMAAPEAVAIHEKLLDSPDAARMDPRVRKRLDGARGFRASDYVHLQWARERLIAQVGEELGGAVLVLPTVAHVAPELEPLERDLDRFVATNLATLRLTMLGSFLDMPGVALPTGVDAAGLTTSVLVSVPSGHDARILSVALAAEHALSSQRPTHQRAL
ncbi:amidase [Pendulispora albinea]|uniref:Amidase n=1 Tax=Pendulispora albinea TaxID=2741071 RepID=A0ABZ2LXM7_9BACT